LAGMRSHRLGHQRQPVGHGIHAAVLPHQSREPCRQSTDGMPLRMRTVGMQRHAFTYPSLLQLAHKVPAVTLVPFLEAHGGIPRVTQRELGLTPEPVASVTEPLYSEGHFACAPLLPHAVAHWNAALPICPPRGGAILVQPHPVCQRLSDVKDFRTWRWLRRRLVPL
jgi:hypothetical protein